MRSKTNEACINGGWGMLRWFVPVAAVVMMAGDLNAQTAGSRATTAAESKAVSVLGVEDLRKTSKDGFPAGLKMTLGVTGVDVGKIKSVECNLTSATDDAGNSLIKKEKGFFDRTEFRPDANNTGFEVEVSLNNPARKAATIKCAGSLDMFIPSADPAATIRVAQAKKSAGTPVKSETFGAAKASVVIQAAKKEQAAGSEAKGNSAKAGGGDDPLNGDMKQALAGMFSMGGGPNSVTIEIVDPEGKIQGIEFFSTDGKQIKSNGSSSMGDAKEKMIKTLDFESPLPDTAEMRIYVATAKAQKKIPFTLTNIALP